MRQSANCRTTRLISPATLAWLLRTGPGARTPSPFCAILRRPRRSCRDDTPCGCVRGTSNADRWRRLPAGPSKIALGPTGTPPSCAAAKASYSPSGSPCCADVSHNGVMANPAHQAHEPTQLAKPCVNRRGRAGRPYAGNRPGVARHPRHGRGNAPARHASRAQVQSCGGTHDGNISPPWPGRAGTQRWPPRGLPP